MDPPDEISANDDRDARADRWTALAGDRRLRAAGLVVLAAVVAVVAIVVTRHQPAGTAPARAEADVTNFRSGTPFNGFAAGVANGQGWWLAVGNVATDGHSCLPAVVLSGEYADQLFPGTNLGLTAAGAPSVITTVPAGPTGLPSGVSFAFFQVPATVRELRVAIGTARPLTLPPEDEGQCGRSFRLAGFGFPTTARVTVTSITSRGETAPYTLPEALVRPSADAPYNVGWQNPADSQGAGTPELVGRGVVGRALYGITAAVGAHGQCFSLTKNAQRVIGYPVSCTPISLIGLADALTAVTPPGGHVLAFAISPSAGVTLITANLPGGKTVRLTPVDVGGRLYAALVTATDPTGFTWYGGPQRIVIRIIDTRSPG
jgi:hypothetical protein